MWCVDRNSFGHSLVSPAACAYNCPARQITQAFLNRQTFSGISACNRHVTDVSLRCEASEKKIGAWRRRSASPPSDLAGQTRALRASSTHVGPRVPRVRPHSAQAWCGAVERRERSTCSRKLFRIILRPIQFAPRSRKPRFIRSINVDGRALNWLQMSISRRDVRVRFARADIA